MAYFHTTVLDEQIKALPTVGTAIGSVATFDTDLTENLIKVVCDIQYSQASGTPTPDNPLPITTYTSLNLSHSGADTSNPNVTNIPFGQTVAKGTLNVTTGVLEITHKYVDLGTLSWVKDTTTIPNKTFFRAIMNDAKTAFTAVCSNYPFVGSYSNLTDKTCAYVYNNRIAIMDSDYDNSTATDFQTAMSGVQLVYELATPIEIQLSATQITALLNENNIWCDTNGDTSVKYILSVGKAIS